ncbi:MAG: GNAT family N-acetyltransferase [Thiobacillaceae bacterium]
MTRPSYDPDWRQRYAHKLRSADDALQVVRSGHHIFVGSGAAVPQYLVERLTARADYLHAAEIVHIMTLGIAPYALPSVKESFRHNAFFVGPNVRDAVAAGEADYTPIFLSEVPRLFRSGRVPIDVALIQVTPPDKHGFCSLGVSVDIVKPATECARVIIAEVNPRMPRTLGNSFVAADAIDAMVEHDSPLPEVTHPPPDDVSRAIGRLVSSLVEDGATLQIGIGSIPDAILECLTDKHDLGLHTEMLSDGNLPLIQSGVINNSRKTLHRGKIIASFVMGTQRLYDFVDDNPLVELHPNDYVNDPFVVAQNERMVAVNAAIEVDLTGQVCSDSLGHLFYSGIGGQVDFIRGAARSKGGRPIIALPSTAQDGTISRIVPQLKPGAGVVTSRGDVHYVVTEYGVADLYGRSARQRAMALIGIAHPDYRHDLLAFAKERRQVLLEQEIPPPGAGIYPHDLETTFTPASGETVLVRPIKPTDDDLWLEFIYSLSEDTIYHRFFRPVKRWSRRDAQHFCVLDYRDRMALVAILRQEERDQLIAVARYERDSATNLAECAFAVHDEWQGRGLGTFLLDYLIRVAMMNGIEGFTALVLADNRRMLHLFQRTGYLIRSKYEDSTWNITFRFDEKTEEAGQ